MQHNKKNCPALIGMYYFVDGVTSSKKIAEMLGIPISTAWQVLNRKYNATEKKEKATTALIDTIEREYLAGASTYELGDKHGVYHGTISKWMRKRGYVRGKGNTEAKRNEGRKRFEEYLAGEYGETFTCIDYTNNQTPYMVRCNVCGLEFTRYPDKKHRITCPSCRKTQLTKKREIKKRKKSESALRREAEYTKEKRCAVCGSVFHSEHENARFCSNRCRKSDKIKKKNERERRKAAARQAEELEKEKTCASCGKPFHSVYESAKYCTECHKAVRYCDHKWRAERYGVAYEPGITTEKLIERDGNICQICGEPCDKNDRSWGASGPYYPSIDHIVAMANGGPHTWDNVQLAHIICNSRKRDLDMEEVIAHAEEQGIADKCA